MSVGIKVPFLDHYERRARLYPALLVVLPAILLFAIWLPNAWGIWKGLGPLLGGAGVTYLLSRIARHQGRKLQRTMEARLGRRTTVALRHRDARINPITKERYHAVLTAHGLKMPSAQEEGADPDRADIAYAAAGDWLRERTRDAKTFALLLKENTEYGFRRNLVALRSVAFGILAASVVVDGGELYLSWDPHAARCLAALGLLICLLAAGLIWVFQLNERFVDDAAWAYGERLLAACDTLPSPGAKKRPSKAKAS